MAVLAAQRSGTIVPELSGAWGGGGGHENQRFHCTAMEPRHSVGEQGRGEANRE